MLDSANIPDGLARILDPVAACFTPEVASRVVHLPTDAALQLRIDELASKCNEGGLSPEEEEEYDSYVRGMDVVAILQAKARSVVSEPNG